MINYDYKMKQCRADWSDDYNELSCKSDSKHTVSDIFFFLLLVFCTSMDFLFVYYLFFWKCVRKATFWSSIIKCSISVACYAHRRLRFSIAECEWVNYDIALLWQRAKNWKWSSIMFRLFRMIPFALMVIHQKKKIPNRKIMQRLPEPQSDFVYFVLCALFLSLPHFGKNCTQLKRSNGV